MFVTDETVNLRSHVTFYRCSLCVSQHVSSEPKQEPEAQSAGYFTNDSSGRGAPLMV